MTRHLIAVVLLSLMVAGCAGVRVGPPEVIKIGTRTITVSGLEGFDAAAVRKPDPNYVLVFVEANGDIVVDQEPIRPKSPGPTVLITWALDSDMASVYTFPDDGITFPKVTGSQPPDDPPICTAKLPKRKTITCVYDKPNSPRRFKYIIKVVNTSGTPFQLDPWVHQP